MIRNKIFVTLFLSLLCYAAAKKVTQNEKVESETKLEVDVGSLEISVDARSPCILRVNWVCTRCGSYSKYLVEWEEDDDSSNSGTAEVAKNQDYYDIDQLISNKTYTIIVSTVPSDETTPITSEPSPGTTDPGEPSAVSGFTIGTVTDTKIPLSWDNTTNKCPIEGFYINWNGVALWDDHRHGGGQYRTDGKSRTSYTIANLMPYAQYAISIQEVTSDFIQGDNKTDDATTEQGQSSAPQVESFTLSSSSINVSWEAPTNPNGVITAYNVQWVLEDDDSIGGSENTTADELSYIISELLACGTYEINVAAINGAGYGKISSIQNSTDESEPPAVDNLQCNYNDTTGEITATWNLVNTSETRCAIDHYVFEVRTEVLWNGELTDPKTNLENNVNEQTISELSPYTSYDIRVSAHTSKYGGETSSCDTITTDEEEPGKPTNVDTVDGSLTNTSFTLLWNDPIDKNGALLNFNVVLSDEEANETLVNDTVEFTDFADAFYTYQFEDLDPDSSYTVSVSAINVAGEGEAEIYVPVFNLLEEYEKEESL